MGGYFFYRPYSDHEVEVVGHQAIGIGSGNRVDVLSILFQKVMIIILCPENGI
jgi:hypothetical protein